MFWEDGEGFGKQVGLKRIALTSLMNCLNRQIKKNKALVLQIQI